jgi:hypothetical protein
LYVILILFYRCANSFLSLNSKRVSGFDQAPAQQGLPIVAPAVTPGMLCSSVVSFCIFTCIYLCWGMMVNGFSGKFHEPLYESIFVPLSLFLMMAGLPISSWWL